MQTKLSISADRLYNALRIALTCASKDETRPSLNQVRLAFGDTCFVAQATDGHRAVEVSALINFAILAPALCEHLISVDVAAQLVAMLKPHVKNSGAMVDVTITERGATFAIFGQSIQSFASTEQFPSLQAVVKLPEDAPASAYSINPSYVADIAKAIRYVSKSAGVDCLSLGGAIDTRFYACDTDDYSMRWVIVPMRIHDNAPPTSGFAWTVNPDGMRTVNNIDSLTATN